MMPMTPRSTTAGGTAAGGGSAGSGGTGSAANLSQAASPTGGVTTGMSGPAITSSGTATPLSSMGSTGGTGTAGTSWGRMALGSTVSGAAGHDTHDRSEPNDEDEKRHVPGLFYDRRNEGRRHAPTDASQTNGHSSLRGVKKRMIEEAMPLPAPPGRRVTPHQRHLN